jgi:hypothetical protein
MELHKDIKQEIEFDNYHSISSMQSIRSFNRMDAAMIIITRKRIQTARSNQNVLRRSLNRNEKMDSGRS